jgi:hypothetical protein
MDGWHKCFELGDATQLQPQSLAELHLHARVHTGEAVDVLDDVSGVLVSPVPNLSDLQRPE